MEKKSKETPMITLSLSLSKEEITLLRNVVSDLGINEPACVSLQLKIANAILDGLEE